MIEFAISDVSNSIDQEARNLISDLILAWARFDSLITQWTIRSFGMGLDEGSVFIGNMDTKSKLDKIKALQNHFGHIDAAAKVAEIAKQTRVHADVRNTICHQTCGGYVKSDLSRLVFSNGKILAGHPGKLRVELIHISQIKEATKFARTKADLVSELVDAFEALQERPSEGSPDDLSPAPLEF